MPISNFLKRAVIQVFRQKGEMIVSRVKDNLVSRGKVVTGNLRDSIKSRVIQKGDAIYLNITTDPYLKFVEKGRSPGKQPPMQSIVKWIQYKGAHGRDILPGQRWGQVQSKGINQKDGKRRYYAAQIRREVHISNERFAYAIARKIAKEGQKGTPIIQPVVDEMTPEIMKSIEEALMIATQKKLTDTWTDKNKLFGDAIKININF